jgi:hypothetical protein
MTVAAFERGAPLMVRAASAGGPPSGSAMTELTTDVDRPRPASAGPGPSARSDWSGGDLKLSWIRRARLGGDIWEGEVPLGEACRALSRAGDGRRGRAARGRDFGDSGLRLHRGHAR